MDKWTKTTGHTYLLNRTYVNVPISRSTKKCTDTTNKHLTTIKESVTYQDKYQRNWTCTHISNRTCGFVQQDIRKYAHIMNAFHWRWSRQDIRIFATGHTQLCSFHERKSDNDGYNRTCAFFQQDIRKNATITGKTGHMLRYNRTCATRPKLQTKRYFTRPKKLHMSCCKNAHVLLQLSGAPRLQLSCCKYAYGRTHLWNYQGRDYQRHQPLWWRHH